MPRLTAEDEPFLFQRPRLLSHKSESQVIYCDAFDIESRELGSCVLKFFPPKAHSRFERELEVYDIASKSNTLQEAVPRRLWSGSWDSKRYQKFLEGRLRSILRKGDKHVDLVALEYIQWSDVISESHPLELRIHAAKSALRSLRVLHDNGIIHGDFSIENILFQKFESYYLAILIDFSASRLGNTGAEMVYEWEWALDYLSTAVIPCI